ncbi:IMPACT family protein [Aspergillus candidus]|uniref:UPF0029-domain-containing protein n=1 Tax=Aspergillus candidus TaxID=41067 RepID=A0A2I2FNV7_ASPCN|nr:UPF0029-domain-containing protein [Aspergillus candidus]PLB42306.1 UPF0029-domain-containing protein [Aspergillus candidus]
MSENTDLAEEIEAINAIYDPDTLVPTTTTTDQQPTATTLRLQLPDHPHLSFLLACDTTYPDTAPRILGTASTAARGQGQLAVDALHDVLARVHHPGAVCLFDLISEASDAFRELRIGEDVAADNTNHHDQQAEERVDEEEQETRDEEALNETHPPPQWTLSDVISEKKSVFVARAARVHSGAHAQSCIDHLLATEKKVAAATHNISAWRVKETRAGGRGDAGEVMIVQDFDDDGEAAAGGRLLHLMQLMDVWDVVVVVTRWYGGIHLGPDRFRIINAAGRDALVKGGFNLETGAGGGGQDKGKKKGKR